jgi:hypothetical protein
MMQYFALLLLFLMVFIVPVAAQSEGPYQAGLLVVHGDGSVITRCVTFTEPEISGLTLLQRSGLQWQSSNGPMGAALCTLDGEGCSVSDCFCQCKQAPCAYWNYFTGSGDGSWLYSGIGAAVRTLKHGDIDGWVWGDGASGPPNRTFDSICGVETSDDVTALLQPSSTPVPPEATTAATVVPSATVIMTNTPRPTTTPSPTPEPTQTQNPAAHQMLSVPETPSLSPTATETVTPTTAPDFTPTPPISPTPVIKPTETGLVGTPWAQLGAFALLVCVLGVLFGLQRRRK